MEQSHRLSNLKVETFSCDSPLYYSDAESARILELLRHLIQFGDEVLLLCGPEGSGRSAMLSKVVERASSQWQICRLDSAGNNDAAMLILRFARCLGINMARVDVNDIVALLQRHLSSSESHYLPVIIIDDAHTLSDEALEAVMLLSQLRLDQERRIRLLLSGNVEMHGRLQQARFSTGTMVHRIDLQPYNHDGIIAYLKYRLTAAGYGGEFPFSRKQLRQIERESGGWPGKINELARELMSRERAPVSPALRLLLAGGIGSLLLAAGVGAWLYLDEKDQQLPEDEFAPHTAQPKQATAPSLDTTPCVDGDQRSECPAVTGGQQGASPESPQAEQTRPLVEPVEPSLAVTAEAALKPQPPGTTGADDATSSAKAPATISNQPLLGNSWVAEQPRENFTLQLLVSAQRESVRKLAEEKSLPAPVAIASFVQEGKLLYVLLQGSYPTHAAAEKSLEQVQAASGLAPWVRSIATLPALSESVPAAFAAGQAPAPLSQVAAGKPLLGAAWLWSRKPGNYTVQIYGAASEGAIFTFVEKQMLTGELGMVKVERAGKPWYLLLQGDYPNAEAAARAVMQLSPEIKMANPWQRTFSSVQDEMVNPAHAPR